jgi:hypothetical protein
LSNFAFLQQPEWPALHDAASRAEGMTNIQTVAPVAALIAASLYSSKVSTSLNISRFCGVGEWVITQ